MKRSRTPERRSNDTIVRGAKKHADGKVYTNSGSYLLGKPEAICCYDDPLCVLCLDTSADPVFIYRHCCPDLRPILPHVALRVNYCGIYPTASWFIEENLAPQNGINKCLYRFEKLEAFLSSGVTSLCSIGTFERFSKRKNKRTDRGGFEPQYICYFHNSEPLYPTMTFSDHYLQSSARSTNWATRLFVCKTTRKGCFWKWSCWESNSGLRDRRSCALPCICDFSIHQSS